jgi:hypothetical protein
METGYQKAPKNEPSRAARHFALALVAVIIALLLISAGVPGKVMTEGWRSAGVPESYGGAATDEEFALSFSQPRGEHVRTEDSFRFYRERLDGASE